MSQRDEIYDRQTPVIEGLIQSRYKQVYELFRSVFNLKFNYSVRLIKDKTPLDEPFQKI